MTLKEARKNARYSQEAVAEKLGVNRLTYAKMEKDPSIVTIDTAKKLSSLFGVGVDEIFFASNYN